MTLVVTSLALGSMIQRSVLIVDDHPLMRRVLCDVLGDEDDLFVAGQASDGAEAIDQFRALRPDITLMDLQMPRFDGIQGIEGIRAVEPGARIVVLTSFPGDARVRRATDAGAAAYVLKTASGTELIRMLRDALSNHSSTPPVRTCVARDPRELTQRELNVLREISSGKTNHAIGDVLSVSEETVKTRVKRILEKLGAKDRAHAVAIAARRGYLDCLEP
jgi:DNA-binding NarL/FixJ family response regulator